MAVATIGPFEKTLQVTNDWLADLNKELGHDDPQRAYRVLRAVLIALRDRLTVEEATDLGAQLPMLIRGIYYESWNPSKTPKKERTLEDFLSGVSANMMETADGDPEQGARAVFKVLSSRVTGGEIEDVKSNLPKRLQELWT